MASAKVIIPASVEKKYDIHDEIARGKFGVVFKASNKKTRETFAVKIMLKKGNKKEDVEKEVCVLKKLNHPNILSFSDYIECGNEYVLVMELLNGGELFDYLTQKEFLDEVEATNYMKQILDGLQYVHKQDIVHLDLKPENIVLKDESAKQLKIIDFGTAQDLSINPSPIVMAGTPEFVAPEVLNCNPASPAADMWAIGVITYVLLTGMSPFLGDNDMETVQNISSGEFEYPDPCPAEGYEDISDLAKKFIDSLLVEKPRDRLSARECLRHTWVTSMTKTIAPRISTARLRAFRARRKWMATLRAVRVSLSLIRLTKGFKKNDSGASNGDMCPVDEDGEEVNSDAVFSDTSSSPK